jgi:hypothetical protein
MADLFPGCDSETVFAEVTSEVTTPEARALWTRLRDEIERRGIQGAVSHLQSEFSLIALRLRSELERLETEI